MAKKIHVLIKEPGKNPRSGNSVCPPMAAAVVRANMPEYAVVIDTMSELLDHIAVG